MHYIFILFLSLLFACSNANAISAVAKQKHPYPLLTNDYNILNENDLQTPSWNLNPQPFNPDQPSGPNIYWQCFPRELIMLTLMDIGHSSSEFGGKENVAYLEIHVLMDNGIKHVYEMRSNWTIKNFQQRFNKWLKLMQGEKYVCLAGHFVDREKTKKNGKIWETNGWIFERIKTQKGSDPNV